MALIRMKRVLVEERSGEWEGGLEEVEEGEVGLEETTNLVILKRCLAIV